MDRVPRRPIRSRMQGTGLFDVPRASPCSGAIVKDEVARLHEMFSRGLFVVRVDDPDVVRSWRKFEMGEMKRKQEEDLALARDRRDAARAALDEADNEFRAAEHALRVVSLPPMEDLTTKHLESRIADHAREHVTGVTDIHWRLFRRALSELTRRALHAEGALDRAGHELRSHLEAEAARGETGPKFSYTPADIEMLLKERSELESRLRQIRDAIGVVT